jgi:hypothetical protein
MIPKTPKPENLKTQNQDSSHMQKMALGKKHKKHFYQPWGGHFPRSNSQSTYKDPNISSGVFIISFESWEGSQKSPTR